MCIDICESSIFDSEKENYILKLLKETEKFDISREKNLKVNCKNN